MARGSFNLKTIAKKVTSSRKVNKVLDARARDRVYRARGIMLDEFQTHPVSREITAGQSADNSSNTLHGYGNLFTFIGFPAGSNPIVAIINLIKRQTYLLKTGARTRISGRRMTKTYRVNYSSVDDIYRSEEAQMPWEAGSWVRGIEEGISSFSYYMYKRFEGGRSKQGLQAQKGGQADGEPQKVRTGGFIPVTYVTEIIRNFRKNTISGGMIR